MWKIILVLLWSSAGFGISAGEIIKKTDQIRNPQTSFEMKVEVKSSEDSVPHLFSVFTKGNNKTLIETLSPSRDKGRDLLMVGENMWAYIPNLKRAVRVSLSQKLTGDAANGDISRMQWAEDYSAKITKDDKKSWELMLSANKKGLTYEKIRVEVEKNTYRPVQADYLSKDGKKLKSAVFTNYQKLAGENRPSQIIISDAVRKNQKSTITISEMKVKSLPNSYFSKEKFQNR